MRLRIAAVDEDASAELRELCDWLRADDDGPDEVRLSTRTGGAVGAMGAAEVIDLVLTHSVAVANLAVVYAGWLRARGNRTSGGFTFTRESDGLSVTVEGGSEAAVRELLAVLATAPAAVEPPAPPPAPEAE